MYLYSCLQKQTMKDASAVPAEAAISAATKDGYAALGFNGGTLEEGQFADAVLIDLHAPNMRPLSDVRKNLVYSADNANVLMTVSGGKIVYERGKYFIGESLDKIYSECEKREKSPDGTGRVLIFPERSSMLQLLAESTETSTSAGIWETLRNFGLDFVENTGLAIVRTIAFFILGLIVIKIVQSITRGAALKSSKLDNSAASFIISVITVILYIGADHPAHHVARIFYGGDHCGIFPRSRSPLRSL